MHDHACNLPGVYVILLCDICTKLIAIYVFVIHHQTQTTVHTQDLTVPETSSKSSSRQQIRQQGRQKTTHTHTIDSINSDSCPAPACEQRSLSGNHFHFIKNLKKYASQLCGQIPLLLLRKETWFKKQTFLVFYLPVESLMSQLTHKYCTLYRKGRHCIGSALIARARQESWMGCMQGAHC